MTADHTSPDEWTCVGCGWTFRDRDPTQVIDVQIGYEYACVACAEVPDGR